MLTSEEIFSGGKVKRENISRKKKLKYFKEK